MSSAAIVTGASSGIGLEISRTLCALGYEVYGFGRNFERPEFLAAEFAVNRFHRIVCGVLGTGIMCGFG